MTARPGPHVYLTCGWLRPRARARAGLCMQSISMRTHLTILYKAAASSASMVGMPLARNASYTSAGIQKLILMSLVMIQLEIL